MAKKISRRQLSEYMAENLIAGKTEVIDQVAAYLLTSGRSKEVDLLARDVESFLVKKGAVVAHLKSAYKLEESEKHEIESLLKSRYDAKEVFVSETVDKDLLGGVVIKTASDEFDGSLRHGINRLKAIKV